MPPEGEGAHDTLIAATHRAQAGALDIEAQAKRRLADEYDAAQERGEVARNGGDRISVPVGNTATAADLGLSRKDIYEARQIPDAEKAEPGIVKRTVQACLGEGTAIKDGLAPSPCRKPVRTQRQDEEEGEAAAASPASRADA